MTLSFWNLASSFEHWWCLSCFNCYYLKRLEWGICNMCKTHTYTHTLEYNRYSGNNSFIIEHALFAVPSGIRKGSSNSLGEVFSLTQIWPESEVRVGFVWIFIIPPLKQWTVAFSFLFLNLARVEIVQYISGKNDGEKGTNGDGRSIALSTSFLNKWETGSRLTD